MAVAQWILEQHRKYWEETPRLHSSWWDLHSQDLRWEPLREFLARKAKADFEKPGSHSNEELRNLVRYTLEDLGPRKNRPRH
ncbi:hypothetical protein YQE_06435, partial [Dendroctonus ponderosae]